MNTVVKKIVDKTYTGYDYTYDGAYPPRVKGRDKKKRARLRRNIEKRLTKEEINRLE